MITIKFPDGREVQHPANITGMQIATGISQRLGKEAIGILVNGEVWDLARPITKDAEINLLTWEDAEGKKMFWHSSAHLMAEALEALYPGMKFGIGPPIAAGFYYDVDAGENHITPDDLTRIEEKMLELARKDNAYIRTEISKADALKYFTEKNDEYKLDLLKDLEDGQITFYEQGNFTDLCRGPHLPSTGYIKAIKLLSIAGAYWRGDESKKQLTRIYGITYPKQKEMEEYLAMLEEAKKRDHRKIGKDLEIFTFDDQVGSGLPLWMPNGAAMIEELESLAKRTERMAGYQRVRTPHLAKESLYITSGHLPYYADSMFPPMEIDDTKYYLKSMNCPHHHKIFDAVPRSYKELPLRLAEYGTVYRYEKSGELFGLMRVRSLQMNDAHIYCTRAQFEDEFKAVNEMYLKYFNIFGIDKYVMRFSTHNPAKLGKKYVDMPELWAETEDMVRKVLINSSIPYIEVEDEAAFYGPKIDVQVWSAIGREFTLATNQVDFAQPISFNLSFRNENNEPEKPIIIHRAPLGTHERFIGFLIEHYAGDFPLWLAPMQVAVLCVNDKVLAFAEKICKSLNISEIRTSLDTRNEKIGRKIRDAELKKIPYMLIIGEKESGDGMVSLRKHKTGDIGRFTIEELTGKLIDEIKQGTNQ
ncbi:MAG: threonine--tRNA ligase [Bacteroidetes bacterium]|nr:threonine--tRNA ligase [Bacteroidota bacterium]